MTTTIIISRKQLQSYGLTTYYAIKITKNIVPVFKKKCTYFYCLSDLITAIRSCLYSPILRIKIRNNLQQTLDFLLQQLGNKIEISFEQGTDSETSCLTRKLLQTMQKTDRDLVELKATAMTIRAKYIKNK
jgi:hypothetical protein